jgi:hypothetical protein
MLGNIILKRSHKEKRSSYAPEGGVRYDGVYRIEKCWRKIGVQVFLYLVHRLHLLLSAFVAYFFLWKTNVYYSGFCFRAHTKSAGISLCAVTMNQLLGPGLSNCLPICIGDNACVKKQHALLTLMLCY